MRDGAIEVPSAVDAEWVERIQQDAQSQLDDPGPWVTDTNPAWFPHAGCDPTITQADTTAVPGRYPADDDRFPLVYGRRT